MHDFESSLVLLRGNVAFPEGPAFAPDGAFWCVEQHGESLIRIDQGILTRHHVGGRPNGIAIASDGLIWFCDSGMNAIRTFCPVTEQSEVVVSSIDGQPLYMPNDLAFDISGNLVFSCPGPSLDSSAGYVCTWSKNREISVAARQLYYPNGVAFTADFAKLLIAETDTHRIWIGDWDIERAIWTMPRVFVQTGGPIGPDGMALDEDGNLYVAVYGSANVKVYDPRGIYLDSLALSGKNPTNCAFDPFGKLGLVVTEAEKGEIIRFPTVKKGIMHHTLGL